MSAPGQPIDRRRPGGRAGAPPRALRADARAHREPRRPLSAEDQQLQSMPDASPTKWHRAHTTWFFEAFVLEPAGIDAVDRRYAHLFNSYYEAVGARHPRAKRGLLSRPSAAEVGDYRRRVDETLTGLLSTADGETLARALPVVELGIAHEEQHQELLLTDILHAFSESPLRPAYPSGAPSAPPARRRRADPLRRLRGRAPGDRRARRPASPSTTSGRATSGGSSPSRSPIGWSRCASSRPSSTKAGTARPRSGSRRDSTSCAPAAPRRRCTRTYRDGELRAVHARRACARRATTSRSCTSATTRPTRSRASSARGCRRRPSGSIRRGEPCARQLRRRRRRCTRSPRRRRDDARGVRQLFGDAWEWTQSSYEPYPGYRRRAARSASTTASSWSSQLVLRGGSCLTPRAARARVLSKLLATRRRNSRWRASGSRATCRREPARLAFARDHCRRRSRRAHRLAKTLPPYLFYDEAGSRLYERITELPEYYLTRAEREILLAHAPDVIERVVRAGGGPLSVVELGAGSAPKTEILLRAAARAAGALSLRAGRRLHDRARRGRAPPAAPRCREVRSGRWP